MKSIMIVKSIAIFCGILCLAACANKTAITPVIVTEITDNLQVTAIMDMRVALGLPNLPLELKRHGYHDQFAQRRFASCNLYRQRR